MEADGRRPRLQQCRPVWQPQAPVRAEFGLVAGPRLQVWLVPAQAAQRKTAYDLKLVDMGGVLVSVDARLPNPLFAEAVRAVLPPNSPVEVSEVSVGGLRLMERVVGYDRVILIDAMHQAYNSSGKAKPGTIHRMSLDDLSKIKRGKGSLARRLYKNRVA